MTRRRKIVFATCTILIGIQFIQPVRNQSGQVALSNTENSIILPTTVETILRKSCFDCHSNNTRYPFYTYIQPIGWFMNYHIQKGKNELNFNEFWSYSQRRQESKLKAIVNQIKSNEMPLSSYTFIHKNAKLTDEERGIIINWASHVKDSTSNLDN